MVKHLLYYSFLISLVGCSGSNEKLESESLQSPIARQDSVYISETPGVQFRVHKDQYNAFVAARAEFFSAVPENPDSTYYSALNSFEEITFTSEIGQDTYYLWYTYFLKKRYAHDNYEAEREKLLELYNSINDIFAIIARGGTFFSHNKPRIQAYAEWDIYNHLVLKRAIHISESDFKKEKEAFIERNRRILESSDSFKYWDSFTEEGRKATLQELQALFESLSEKIDTPYYLSCVLKFEQRFQHLILVVQT